jgi:AcrR family transcriptional regulator
VQVRNGAGTVAPRRRGRPRRADASEAILDATLQLLADRGFHATTMDAIAARAGVGKNTIYRRWVAKDDLIIDAFSHFVAPLELRRDGDDLYGRLREYARSLERIYADPLASRLLPGLLGELQRNPAFASAYAERVLKPIRDPLVALLEHARERGELRRRPGAGRRPPRRPRLLPHDLRVRLGEDRADVSGRAARRDLARSGGSGLI